MMFCPECKSLMMASAGKLRCKKCGYIKDISDATKLQKTKERTDKEIIIVDDDTNLITMPTITVRCSECGNRTAEWWMRQLRSADESETRFFRCTKCKFTWREYD